MHSRHKILPGGNLFRRKTLAIIHPYFIQMSFIRADTIVLMRTLTYHERDRRETEYHELIQTKPQLSQVSLFTLQASKKDVVVFQSKMYSSLHLAQSSNKIADENRSINQERTSSYQSALDQDKVRNVYREKSTIDDGQNELQALLFIAFRIDQLANPSRPRVLHSSFIILYFSFFLLTWFTREALMQGVRFLQLGVLLQIIVLGFFKLHSSFHGPTCHPELHCQHNKGRYSLSMMWTHHSPHVHVTCPPSGSRGYVVLQGVAKPLRNDHSLFVSKTMSGRRSHHLPRPSLGRLIPD